MGAAFQESQGSFQLCRIRCPMGFTVFSIQCHTYKSTVMASRFPVEQTTAGQGAPRRPSLCPRPSETNTKGVHSILGTSVDCRWTLQPIGHRADRSHQSTSYGRAALAVSGISGVDLTGDRGSTGGVEGTLGRPREAREAMYILIQYVHVRCEVLLALRETTSERSRLHTSAFYPSILI